MDYEISISELHAKLNNSRKTLAVVQIPEDWIVQTKSYRVFALWPRSDIRGFWASYSKVKNVKGRYVDKLGFTPDETLYVIQPDEEVKEEKKEEPKTKDESLKEALENKK